MRHALCLAGLACAVAACAPSRLVAPLRYESGVAAPDQPFRAEPPPLSPVTDVTESVRETTLPNGVRVVLIERHDFPLVAAELVADRGSLDLADAGGIEVQEIAYLFGRGGDEATHERLSADAAKLGIGSGTGATVDYGWAEVASGTDSLDAAFDDLASLAHARLSPEEYDRRAAEWAGRGGYAPGPVEVLEKRVLFDMKHPYGYAGPGPTPIERAEAQSLHDRIFQPAHATLVIVGDVTPAQVDASVLRSFGSWVTTLTVPKNATPPPAKGGHPLVVLPQPALVQRYGAVFARGPVPTSPDMEAFELLAKVLGGAHSSKLHSRLRQESGAAYEVRAPIVRLREATWVSLVGSYDADKAVAGVGDVLAAIDRVRKGGVSDDEISTARETLLAGWRGMMSTSAGAARLYAHAIALGVGIDRVRDFPARVTKLDRQDLSRVARAYLAQEALHVAFVGNVRGLDTDPLGVGPRSTFRAVASP